MWHGSQNRPPEVSAGRLSIVASSQVFVCLLQHTRHNLDHACKDKAQAGDADQCGIAAKTDSLKSLQDASP